MGPRARRRDVRADGHPGGFAPHVRAPHPPRGARMCGAQACRAPPAPARGSRGGWARSRRRPGRACRSATCSAAPDRAGGGRGRAARRRLRRGRAPGRPRVRPLAADREGAASRHPARLRDERRADPGCHWRAPAGDRSRLVRDGLREVADVDPGCLATVRRALPGGRLPLARARSRRSGHAHRPPLRARAHHEPGERRASARRARRSSEAPHGPARPTSPASRSASTTAPGRWRRSNAAASTRGRSGAPGRACIRNHRLAVRATDRRGATQPERPVPNAGGYCANAVHRVAVAVEED